MENRKSLVDIYAGQVIASRTSFGKDATKIGDQSVSDFCY